MMHLSKYLSFLLLIGGSLLFSDCKKKAVASSTVVSAYSSDWAVTNNVEYDVTFAVPEITGAVNDRGTVQLFYSDSFSGQWEGMPFSYGNTQYNFTYGVGKVTVFVTLDSGALPGNPGAETFKIVVTPPAS